MHVGGSSDAAGAPDEHSDEGKVLAAARRCKHAFSRLPARTIGTRLVSSPAFGLVVLTPLVLAAAVGASAPRPPAVVANTAVTPLAAVWVQPEETDGPAVVSVARPPTSFHFADAATISPPPPAIVINSPGSLGIPSIALNAYRSAERMMAMATPGCGVSWNLLAGIGRIESMHANNGATDVNGTTVDPIYGPALDGTLPGNEVIVQSVAAGQVTYARAMGPMQFLPGTWSRYASDGDGDGKSDPQNLYDATLAAARYLCSGGLNLRDQPQIMTAVLRYNNSVAYAHNVLGWAAAYATGVVPVNLPPISGSAPVADLHLDVYTGLGPGLPMNAAGLPPTDPLAQIPLVDFGQTDVANQLPEGRGPLPGPGESTVPGPGGMPQTGPCTLICFGQNQVPAPGAAPGPVPGPVVDVPIPSAGPAPAVGPAPGPVAEATPSAPPVAPQPLPQAPGPPPGPAA